MTGVWLNRGNPGRILNSKERVEEIRRRLSSLSWFMKALTMSLLRGWWMKRGFWRMCYVNL